MTRINPLSFFICIVIAALSSSVSAGTVVVFDRISTVGTPIYLKALTKGKFFPEGGIRVTFEVEGKLFGKNMSGGDGYAYLKYTPEKTGLKRLAVRSETGHGTGSILVLDKNARALGIEIVGGLRESILSPNPMPGSVSALTMLRKNFQIVYFTKPLTVGYLKNWIIKENFPKSIVLSWTGANQLKNMQEKGIVFHAMIGSSALVSEVSEFVEHRFTFEDTRDGVVAEDWNDILNSLK
jgi:hypothetical protein